MCVCVEVIPVWWIAISVPSLTAIFAMNSVDPSHSSLLHRRQYLPALFSRMQCSGEVWNARQITSTGDFLPSCHVMSAQSTDNCTRTLPGFFSRHVGKVACPGPHASSLEQNQDQWSALYGAAPLMLIAELVWWRQ